MSLYLCCLVSRSRFAYAGISDHDWLEEGRFLFFFACLVLASNGYKCSAEHLLQPGWNKTAWAPWHVSAAVHCCLPETIVDSRRGSP